MCLMFAYVLEIPFEIDGKRKSALGHCTCSTVDFLLSSALSDGALLPLRIQPVLDGQHLCTTARGPSATSEVHELLRRRLINFPQGQTILDTRGRILL